MRSPEDDTSRPTTVEEVGLDAVFANVSAALAIVRGAEAIYEKTMRATSGSSSIGR
jgi:hypothetical protein